VRLISPGWRKTTTAPPGRPEASITARALKATGWAVAAPVSRANSLLSDRVLAGLPVLQVDEAEDLAGVLPEALGEGAAEPFLSLGVEIDDLAGGVGEQHAFLELGEQHREVGGGKAEDRLGGGGRLRQGNGEADDALQLLLAGDLSHDAGVGEHVALLAVAQAQGVEVGHLAGVLGEEVGLHAARRLVHRQAAQEGLEGVGQFAVGVAEQRLETG